MRPKEIINTTIVKKSKHEYNTGTRNSANQSNQIKQKKFELPKDNGEKHNY